MSAFADRVSFAVPAGAGAYAPESLTFDVPSAATVCPPLDAIELLVETVGAATGAVAELWLPRVQPSTRPVPDAEYFYSGKSVTGAGGDSFPLVQWRGARIRVKSAGVAGTAVVSARAN